MISEGLPVEEIQKLCDVHASVFKGSIEEIHQSTDPSVIPGHPLNILKLENREIERIIKDKIRNKLNLIPSMKHLFHIAEKKKKKSIEINR